MKSDSMTRKEFVTLTFTLIGVGATIGSCSSSNANNTDATGLAGNGVSGTSGTDATGASGTTGTTDATGASGTTGGTACMDPLPEVQDPDANGHVHMVTVPAATLVIQTVGVLQTFGYLGIAYLIVTMATGFFMQNPPAGWQPAGWKPSASLAAQRAAHDSAR